MTISRNLSILAQYVSTSGVISQTVTLPQQTGNIGKYLTTNGTSASWDTVTIPSTFTGDVTGTSGTSGTTSLILGTTGVGTGTYTNATVTVDSKGRITAATSGISGSNVFTGDVTGTGTSGTASLALSTSGVAAGTYGHAVIIVDNKGRVTSASVGTFAGDVTGTVGTSGTASLILGTTGVGTGTYTNATVTVDSKGRITAATSGISGSNVFTGDVTGTGTSGTASLILGTTGVGTGTYTNATVTVDSKGRITAATSGISGSNVFTGDVTGTGTSGTASLALSTSGVAAGTYGHAVIIVDNKGRVTSASVGTFAGDVTGTVGTSGTASLILGTTGVGTGTYTNATVTVDSKGRITAATSGISGSNVFTGDVTGTGTSGTASLALSTSGVAAGTYGVATIVVDNKGRVTSANNGIFAGDVSGLVGTSGIASLTLSTSGVTPATYTNATVTVDVKGRITAATSGIVTNTFIGDVTGTGTNGTASLILGTSGVTAGVYTNANISVDDKGRIISASNGAAGGSGTGGTTTVGETISSFLLMGA